MASVYSVRFFELDGITGVTVGYTVPTGCVAVVRCVTFTQEGGSGSICQVIGPSAIDCGAQSVTSELPITVNLRQVHPAGEAIRVFPLSGTWNVTASGYLLEAT